MIPRQIIKASDANPSNIEKVSPTAMEKASTDPDSGARVIRYAGIAFVCFLLALSILVLLLWKARMLVALGLTGNLYFIALVPLGIFVALTLFGILESVATYKGKHLGGVLKLGGPVVAFFLVLLLGFWLPQPQPNFPITVYVHGPGGNQDLILKGTGFVGMDTGGLRRKAAIDKDGAAFFPEIPANFRGQEVSVSLDAAGYELADSNQTARLDSSSFYLLAKRKPGVITGYVHEKSGRPLNGVSIAVVGLTTTTDATGYFNLTIPGDKLEPEMTLQATYKGYVPITETVVSNSNEMSISMHR
jgi:hypothetical protein